MVLITKLPVWKVRSNLNLKQQYKYHGSSFSHPLRMEKVFHFSFNFNSFILPGTLNIGHWKIHRKNLVQFKIRVLFLVVFRDFAIKQRYTFSLIYVCRTWFGSTFSFTLLFSDIQRLLISYIAQPTFWTLAFEVFANIKSL